MRYVAIQTMLFVALIAAAVTGYGPALLSRSTVLTVLGLIVAAAAVVLAVIAYLSLGNAFHLAPEPQPQSSLVTAGVYRKFRHPMYTAASAVSLGVFLARPTVFVGLSAVALCVFLLLKAHHEEKLLRRRFPDYADYTRRSWGVLPFLRR